MGPLSALGQVCAELFLALVGGFVACALFIFVLRVVLRKTWPAVIAFLLFYSIPSIVNVNVDYHGAATVMIWAAIGLVLFFRFGVLTVAVGWFTWRLLSWPVSFDYTAAHLEIGVVAHLSLLALALYACLRSSTWSNPLVRS
ncbi:hypothetical protein ACFL2H_13240 [Planctomycetota bacterium]